MFGVWCLVFVVWVVCCILNVSGLSLKVAICMYNIISDGSVDVNEAGNM